MFIGVYGYIYGMKLLKSVRVAHKVVQVSATTQENLCVQTIQLMRTDALTMAIAVIR